MPWWLSEFAIDAPWDSPALVSALSAFIHAHLRLKEPSTYQQALLVQANAQLTSLPCALYPAKPEASAPCPHTHQTLAKPVN